MVSYITCQHILPFYRGIYVFSFSIYFLPISNAHFQLYVMFHSHIVVCMHVIVVVSSPHQSPRCGVSRFRSAQSIAIPLSVWSASISPAH